MGNPLFESEFRTDKGAGFTIKVRQDRRSETRFFGKGEMAVTYAYVKALEEALATIGDEPVPGIVYLAELEKSPLRAQFVLGKWLHRNKRHFTKVAICGAKPWEAKLAGAIMKMAGMKEFSFFDETEKGEAWLDESYSAPSP